MKTLTLSLLFIIAAAGLQANNRHQEPPTLWKIFTVTPAGYDVVLNWVTITEMNVVTYYVQHSKDALHWECIDTIATENASFTGTEFRFIHKNPGSGDHYYRVITIDQVGFEESSPVRKITQENVSGLFRILENPVTGKTAKVDCAAPIEIQLMDRSGKLLLRRKLEAGNNMIDLSQIQSGLYIISAGGNTNKLIVN